MFRLRWWRSLLVRLSRTILLGGRLVGTRRLRVILGLIRCRGVSRLSRRMSRVGPKLGRGQMTTRRISLRRPSLPRMGRRRIPFTIDEKKKTIVYGLLAGVDDG